MRCVDPAVSAIAASQLPAILQVIVSKYGRVLVCLCCCCLALVLSLFLDVYCWGFSAEGER